MAQSAKVLGIQKMAKELREAQESAVIDAELVEETAVVAVSQAEAERIDKSARLLADSARGTFDRLLAKLDEGKAGDVWRTLGFASWTAWIADVLGNQPLLTTDKAERRELVTMLHTAGMSGRAIAQAAHVSEGTVRNDLRSVQTREAERAAQHRVEREAHVAEERAQDCAPVTSKTTGLDGKIYTRPTAVPDQPAEPQKPRRRPLPEAYSSAVSEFGKAFGRLERLTADDRFAANRETIGLTEFGSLDALASALEQNVLAPMRPQQSDENFSFVYTHAVHEAMKYLQRLVDMGHDERFANHREALQKRHSKQLSAIGDLHWDADDLLEGVKSDDDD